MLGKLGPLRAAHALLNMYLYHNLLPVYEQHASDVTYNMINIEFQQHLFIVLRNNTASGLSVLTQSTATVTVGQRCTPGKQKRKAEQNKWQIQKEYSL